MVGRDELQRMLWDGPTFVDFEQGLNSAVNKLRQALGDSASQPRYLETLPGRGYRFIAPVRQASDRAVHALGVPAGMPRIESGVSQSKIWLGFAVAGALTIIAGGGYWIAKGPKEPELRTLRKFTVPAPARFAFEGAASRQSFALSPDGSRLAFTAMDSSGAFSVFVRDFKEREPRLVPSSEGAHTVFWHPDGRSLYMTIKGKLYRTPLESDAHVLLADAPPFPFSGAWLSPQRILLDGIHTSFFVSPSGGPLEQLKENYLWPQRLPDGEHFLYVRWNPSTGHHQARVAWLRDFSTKDLGETDSRVLYTASTATPETGYLLYVRGGSLLAQAFNPRTLQFTAEVAPVASRIYSFAETGAADFSVSDRGVIAFQNYVSRSQLVWVDRTGRQLGTVGPADVNVKSGRLSPDGKQLATAIYDVEKGEQNLWIVDLKTRAARRLTAEPGLRDAPVWSPDSTTLAFAHTADTALPRIHLRGMAPQDAEEPMPALDLQLPADWSPDGRFVAFSNTGFPRLANEQQSDVWLLDVARRKLVPALRTRFHEANPAFSPDGKWLAFTSDESGRAEVYLQAFRGDDTPGVVGRRNLVSSAGALALRWRRDGRELFFLDFEGRVQAVPVKFSPEPQFGAATALFTISTEARAAIHSIMGFDVSADGQRFVIPVVSSAEAPSIVVVRNWEALLPHARR